MSTEHSLHIAPCHTAGLQCQPGGARARNGRADDIDTNVTREPLARSQFEQHQSQKISNLVLPLDHEAEDRVTRCYNLDPKIPWNGTAPLSFAPIAMLTNMHLVMSPSNVPGTGQEKQG